MKASVQSYSVSTPTRNEQSNHSKKKSETERKSHPADKDEAAHSSGIDLEFPIYAGIRTINTNKHLLGNPFTEKHQDGISEKCACCMVTAILVAIVLGLLSLGFSVLVGTGIIFPSNSERLAYTQSAKQLNNLLLQLKQDRNKTNKMLIQQSRTIENIIQQLKQFNGRKTQSSDKKPIKRLPSSSKESFKKEGIDQISVMDIFRNMITSTLSRCSHEEFSIGISSAQVETESGEYNADQEHIIIGVTCSATPGFIGSLKSRIVLSGGTNKTFYKCKCVKIFDFKASSGGRAECRINYWQCPTNITFDEA